MREGLMYHGLIDIGRVKLNTASKRTITIKKLNNLKKSIQEFPEMTYLRPVILNKDNMILGGNMRYRAMVDLGYEEIPFIKIEDITPEQELQFIVKDNAHWGDWSVIEYTNPTYEVKDGKQKTIKINSSVSDYDTILQDLSIIKTQYGLHDHSQVLKLLIDHLYLTTQIK